MRVLLTSSDSQLGPWLPSKHIGQLLIPGNYKKLTLLTDFVAADNGAYSEFDPDVFSQMCRSLVGRKNFKWVAVPDVVGDWKATRDRFTQFKSELQLLGLPLAYVLQDGQPLRSIPFDELKAVFLGGTTEFKLSTYALGLCKEARRRRKLVHIGRVNSVKRASMFLGVAHTFDGTSFSRFNKTHLPGILKWLSTVSK